jgi:hypothetical protein
VKVPSIPASSTKTIYVYYGNPSATSASNGANTFIFFDDFEDGVYTDKWTANTLYGTVTETGGKLTMTRGNAYYCGAGVTSINTFSAGDYVIETYVMRETGYKGGELGLDIGFTNKAYRDTTYYGHYYCVSGDIQSCAHGDVYEYSYYSQRLRASYYDAYAHGSTSLESWDGKWVRMTIKIINSAKQTSARFVYGSTDITLTTGTGSSAITPLYLQIHYGDANCAPGGQSSYADWIAVRKYSPSEPAIGVGAEECSLAPLGITVPRGFATSWQWGP